MCLGIGNISWDDVVPKMCGEMSCLHFQTNTSDDTTCHKILLLLPRSCMNFSDASENVYAAVIYLSVTGALGNVHASLIISIRPQSSNSFPRLELCGPHLLPKLLHHVRGFLNSLSRHFRLNK